MGVEPPLRLDDDRARRKRVGRGESFHPIIVFPVSFLAFLTALGILYFPEEFRTHNNNNKSARITTQFQIYIREKVGHKRDRRKQQRENKTNNSRSIISLIRKNIFAGNLSLLRITVIYVSSPP